MGLEVTGAVQLCEMVRRGRGTEETLPEVHAKEYIYM